MLLPIPKLEDTLQKYLEWVSPLLSKAEYENTQKIVAEFGVIAPDLQKFLEEEQAIYSHTSWLALAWQNAYLDGRESMSMSTNFAIDIPLQKTFTSQSQTIASFINALGKVCKSYIDGSFGQIYDNKNDALSMDQFHILKGGARIPASGRDFYHINQQGSNYMTVFYKNRLFKIELWDLQAKQSLNPLTCIEQILTEIKEQEASLATICFSDSDTASNLYKKYYDSNPFFNILENSLFNLSIIDEELPTLALERYHNLYLSADNSWLYKSLNFIYNLNNQHLFLNCEHTYQDAGTMLEIVKRMHALYSEALPVEPAKLLAIKEYTDEAYFTKVKEIKEAYRQKIEKIGCVDLFLPLKDEELGDTNKDALLQVLLQYAQQKAFGQIRSTYEAVDMRKYQYGRTECVRPVSKESVAFVDSLGQNSPHLEQLEKFKQMQNEHKNRIKMCKNGEGVERHLYGLYIMASRLTDDKSKQIVARFFGDNGYKKLSQSFVSTSTLGYNPYVGIFLFTPVVPRGFGVTYQKESEGLRYIISYYKSEQTHMDNFCEGIKQALAHIKELLATSKKKLTYY